MSNRRKWITRDGQNIRIKDLSDTHLRNIIGMLERKAQHTADSCSVPAFQGEMAQFYAESDFMALQEDPIEFILVGSIYDDLIEEAARRRLET